MNAHLENNSAYVCCAYQYGALPLTIILYGAIETNATQYKTSFRSISIMLTCLGISITESKRLRVFFPVEMETEALHI